MRRSLSDGTGCPDEADDVDYKDDRICFFDILLELIF